MARRIIAILIAITILAFALMVFNGSIGAASTAVRRPLINPLG